MSHIPSDLKYTETHEWARIEENGEITVGITDHAQALLGDVVYIELPEVDTEADGGDDVGVVESVKAASDLYLPVSGTVIAINDSLASNPGLINSDPYGEGWLYRIQADDDEELDELLNAEEYAEQVASEGH